MSKKLLITLVVIGAMTISGVASAANHIGVGYYFQGDGRGLTLKGELALTDVVDLGIDYFGIENAGWADIWASMDLKEFGDALVGAYGGVRLYTAGGTSPDLLIGVWGEQPVHPQLMVYGDAGLGVRLGAGSAKAWLEAVGGIMADVYDPFRSSITGNLTSTPFMSFHSIFSLIVLSHAMWLVRPSMDRPINSQLSSRKSSCIDANVMNSVVHTGVKSAGWLNRITHLPL
jgi:hypothetical protein